MRITNRSWGRDLTVVTAPSLPTAVAHRRAPATLVLPLSLSLALTLGVLLFSVATYPLWPRMYLSPVLDLVPPLADLLLALFSTDLAHRAVEVTGGNVFFYMYTTATIVLFVAYLAALRYARRVRARPFHLRWIVLSTAFVSALMILTPTLFTADLFSYIMYGRMASTYGANPLVTSPRGFFFDPVYPLVFWKDTVSVYGPVWISLSSVLMAVVPPVVGQQIALFKIVAILFHLANAVLIWCILRRLAPRYRLSGTVAYAWNPLLLIEFAANGHNDVVMVFFMLLSMLAIVRGHRVRPLIFLVAAILTKWVAVFLLPIYLVGVLREEPDWRHRCRYLLRGGSTMVAVAVLLYLPYWSGLVTFTAMFDSAAIERFINSFPELMVKPFSALLKGWLPAALAQGVTEANTGYALKAALGAGFLVFWLREVWWARPSARVAAPWLRTLFAYLLIACTWFWPWYISWLVPFAALNGWSRLTQATLLFTLSGAFFYSLWPGAPLRPFEPYYEFRAAALFGLPLLYLLVGTIGDRWHAPARVEIEGS